MTKIWKKWWWKENGDEKESVYVWEGGADYYIKHLLRLRSTVDIIITSNWDLCVYFDISLCDMSIFTSNRNLNLCFEILLMCFN